MKIVVTGSNGRIGRNVVKVALNAGHTVHGIDSVEAPERLDFYSDSNFSFDKADLRDYEQALRLLQGAQAVRNQSRYQTQDDMSYKYKTKPSIRHKKRV